MANKRRGAQRAGSGAIWGRGFVTGLATGALGAAAVYFLVLSPAQPDGSAAHVATPGTDHQDGTKISGPKPKFEFYTILPELEVPVPDQTAADPRQATLPPALQTPPPGNLPSGVPAAPGTPASATPVTVPVAPPPAASGGRYILQAGSSRNGAEAERLRASLALQGMVAQVQAVTVNGETWHRIRVGPFESRADADASQRQLRSANINTMLLELRAP